MLRTLYVGNLYCARIYIHWSFWLLALLIVLSNLSEGLPHAVSVLGFVFAVFACVFLHEVGHAVAARAFGRATRDITLLPIGGVARIEGGELNPRAEGWIAIAGPAVNFAIAALLAIVVSIASWNNVADAKQLVKMSPWQQLFIANIFLGGANLIPAFPLDGGRLLRSILCYWLESKGATVLASRIGQWTSGLMVLTAIAWWNGSMILFGVILFLINTFQRIQSQLMIFTTSVRGPGAGGSSPWNGPFDHDPYSSNGYGPFPYDRSDLNGPGKPDGKTIDAIEVKELP